MFKAVYRWCGPGWAAALAGATVAGGVAMAATAGLCVLSGEPCEASAEVYQQQPRGGKRAVPASTPPWFDPALGEVHVLHTFMLIERPGIPGSPGGVTPHHDTLEVPDNFVGAQFSQHCVTARSTASVTA